MTNNQRFRPKAKKWGGADGRCPVGDGQDVRGIKKVAGRGSRPQKNYCMCLQLNYYWK